MKGRDWKYQQFPAYCVKKPQIVALNVYAEYLLICIVFLRRIGVRNNEVSSWSHLCSSSHDSANVNGAVCWKGTEEWALCQMWGNFGEEGTKSEFPPSFYNLERPQLIT